MDNRKYIENELSKKNLKLGIYDDKLNSLNKKKIDFILDSVDSCNKVICINRKYHIVEIFHIFEDNKITEIDFNVITIDKYIRQYGNEIIEEGRLQDLKEEYQKFMKK